METKMISALTYEDGQKLILQIQIYLHDFVMCMTYFFYFVP